MRLEALLSKKTESIAITPISISLKGGNFHVLRALPSQGIVNLSTLRIY